MRNAAALLPAKLASLSAQDAGDLELEVILASDGSTDATPELIVAASEGTGNVKAVVLKAHGGKHVALNGAVAASTGDVLVFTDVDAVLEPHAVALLAAALKDSDVGGVCGRRMIGEPDAFASAAQSDYVALDSGLKAIESRRGSITSNDGKLYALARECFEEVPAGVTDDLFANMSTVRQGKRFVYEGRARAWIKSPSRSTAHELGRRRRIVCRSLRGIRHQRAVLNPARTGVYAVGLAVNKVGRRLLPIFLLTAAAGVALLAIHHDWARALGALGALGVLVAWLQPTFDRLPLPKLVKRVMSLGHYFVVGNVGTLFGLMDFVRDRQVVRWDPIKAD